MKVCSSGDGVKGKALNGPQRLRDERSVVAQQQGGKLSRDPSRDRASGSCISRHGKEVLCEYKPRRRGDRTPGRRVGVIRMMAAEDGSPGTCLTESKELCRREFDPGVYSRSVNERRNIRHDGGSHVKRINAVVVLLLCTALAVGLVSLGAAGEQHQTPVKAYEGQIKSIKIDKCGLQPGSCEGSIVIAQKAGGDVILAIMPGTWIKRGDHLVLIDELGVGNYVKAQATPLPAGAPREGTVGSSPGERAITLEETGRGD